MSFFSTHVLVKFQWNVVKGNKGLEFRLRRRNDLRCFLGTSDENKIFESWPQKIFCLYAPGGTKNASRGFFTITQVLMVQLKPNKYHWIGNWKAHIFGSHILTSGVASWAPINKKLNFMHLIANFIVMPQINLGK